MLPALAPLLTSPLPRPQRCCEEVRPCRRCVSQGRGHLCVEAPDRRTKAAKAAAALVGGGSALRQRAHDDMQAPELNGHLGQPPPAARSLGRSGACAPAPTAYEFADSTDGGLDAVELSDGGLVPPVHLPPPGVRAAAAASKREPEAECALVDETELEL